MIFRIPLHQVLLLGLSVLSSRTAVANLMECVPDGEFDETTDYFPDKIETKESKFWEIEYFNSYKVLKNEVIGESFILYQCGTPMPTNLEGVDPTHVISVPIKDGVALGSTTHIPSLELLGLRSEIKAWMGGAGFISSPCLNQMINEGDVVVVSDTKDETAVNALKEKVGPNIVSFHNSRQAYPSELLNVTMAAYFETSNLAIFEWMKFFAVFFNMEVKAKQLYSDVDERYTCTADEAAVIASRGDRGKGVKPTVIWASWTDYNGISGWNVGVCPNYYCELAADCAAEFITSRDGTIEFFSSMLFTTEAFVELAAGVEHWIYSSTNWDTAFALHGEVLSNFKSVQKKQVFDTNGAGPYAWFEDRLAEVDVVLQDFCAVVGTADPRHNRVWLRDVFTEDKHSNYEETCVDPNAPLVPRATPCVQPNICFSGDSTVQVLSSTSSIVTKQMREVRIGDKIQTGVSSYDEVYGFGHWQSDQKAAYLQLHLEGCPSPLEISEQHMVYTSARDLAPVSAKSLKLGDTLLLADTSKSCGTTITKISSVVRNGAFAPFTTSGKIVVNGVVASNYVSLTGDSYYLGDVVSHHWLAHVLTTPLRLSCLYGKCNHVYNEDGLWTSIPLDLAKSLLTLPFYYQALILIPSVLINLSLMAVERMLTTWFGLLFGVTVGVSIRFYGRIGGKKTNLM